MDILPMNLRKGLKDSFSLHFCNLIICYNLKFCVRDKMVLHHYYKGFDVHYTVWTSHGEIFNQIEESSESDINSYRRLVVEGFGPEFQKL